MAAIALGVVGAGIGGAIGGTFLGMSATGIGWMVGSTLGNFIGQKSQHVQGPRQSDLSVQASTYGATLPVLRGTMRAAGNVIWSTPKQPLANTEEVGGKGGPSVSQTTYTYHVSMAVALCEGAMAGIRKIWSNGKLIYDASTGITAASAMASSVRALAMRFYPGDEAQLPDPTIEAAMGAGNAPAYRGTCYVVFEQLDCPNGQVPQLHFEVVESATWAPEAVDHLLAPAVSISSQACVLNAEGGWLLDTSDNSRWRLVGGEAVNVGIARYVNTYVTSQPWRPVQGSGSRLLRWAQTDRWIVESLDLSTGTVSHVWDDPATTTGMRLLPKAASWDAGSGQYCTFSDTGEMVSRWIMLPGGLKGDIIPSGDVVSTAVFGGVVYVALLDAGNTVVRTYSASTGAQTGVITVATPADIEANTALLSAHEEGVFAYLYQNDPVSSYPSRVYRINADSSADLLASFELGVGPTPNTVWCGPDYALVGPFPDGSGGVKSQLVRYAPISPTPVSLASVVSDICARSGLDASQVDVTALSGSVPGYGITRQGSGRAALDPIMSAWFVDAAEVDGLLRFTHRTDKTPVATIGWDQLGASADSLRQADAAPLTRTQAAELPRSVTVTYLNTAADYQAASEQQRRHDGTSVNDQVLDIPVATTADHAAAVAQALLYTAWVERNRRSISLPRQWAALDAGDIITIETSPGQWSTMIAQRINDDGTTIAMELADADVGLLNAPGYGASPDAAQTGVQGVAVSGLQVVDVPLLREQDDDAGLYIAMYPVGSGWSGAALYAGQSADDLQSKGSVTRPATAGYAITALGAWNSRLADETNAVTVRLVNGALYSISRAAQLDGNSNICRIGDELLSFRSATDLGGGTYLLSGLLRGLRGTERHASSHQAGEDFTLLDAGGLLRVPLNAGQIGAPFIWRAASFGQQLAQGTTVHHTPTGASARPLSPVGPRKAVATGGDITITWDRRTRSLQDFPANGADVPLFEASEAYDVDVFTSAGFTTVARTLSCTSAIATYTAAQQMADFGALQTTVHLRIHQVGAAGRGDALQANL